MEERNGRLVCGIDEAGRGALAGPVYAGAVVLPDDFPTHILRDSKALTPRSRERVAKVVFARATYWGVGWASFEEIDAINILQASLVAMGRAFEALREKAAGEGERLTVVVDGLYTPCIDAPCVAVVKADATVYEVMAASIVAKVSRDAEMVRLAGVYPGYGYERHKGYPTPQHKAILRARGPSPIQRTTFKY
jgi:ribonuclease HII